MVVTSLLVDEFLFVLRITLEMAAMFFKWPPKWRIQLHDVFGNTFFWNLRPTKPWNSVEIEGPAPLSLWDRRITLEMGAILFEWPPQWRMQWQLVFSNTFSEIYVPVNLWCIFGNSIPSKTLLLYRHTSIHAIPHWLTYTLTHMYMNALPKRNAKCS